eukprot:s574_g19.t1
MWHDTLLSLIPQCFYFIFFGWVDAMASYMLSMLSGQRPQRAAQQATTLDSEAPPLTTDHSPAKSSPNPKFSADDDSDDGVGPDRQRWYAIERILLVDDNPEEVAELTFSVAGVLLDLDVLRPYCAKRHIAISKAVAQHLTGGILPGNARVLQSGRLALNKSSCYKLTLPFDENARQGAGRWLSCGKSFFNFVLKQWQPATGLVSYLPRRHLLYCAFAPAEDALFVKLGFRALGDRKPESVVRYVEQKTRKLRMTNILGAGLFLMPLPDSHGCFDAPEKAAEESLKSAIRCSPHLRANPSGSNGEFVAFSGLLEYYFVKAKGEGTALQGLGKTLRDFTGNQNLKPFRSVMTPGQVRAGRIKLVEWSDWYNFQPDTKASQPRLPLPRASALLSWQKLSWKKLGAFSRRVSRGVRKLSKPSLGAVYKKRRKAWSCPL